jgi:hypothetical protein
VYFDAVRIPLLYHVGGFRSTMSSELVQSIDLAPGGYGAEYGRGLGGLVTVETRALRQDHPHVVVASDILDSSAFVEVPIDKQTRAAIAGRYSYLNNVLSAVTSYDVSQYVPIPAYWDAQLKFERDLRENESVTVLGLASHDKLIRTVTNPDPSLQLSDDQMIEFGRVAVTYKRSFADHSSVTLIPSVGFDSQSRTQTYGSIPTSLDESSLVAGFRARYRKKAKLGDNDLTMNLGIDMEASQSKLTRHGSLTLPAREGDLYVFGEPPPPQVNYDSWNVGLADIAPYAQADIELGGNRVHIVPGLRLDCFNVNGDHTLPYVPGNADPGYLRNLTVVEPRLAVRWAVNDKITLKAAGGQYHQAPVAEDLSPVFGNPNLGFSSAWHALIGGQYRFNDKPDEGVPLSVEVTAFSSFSDGLSTRNLSPSPAQGEALVNEGIGRAYGAQILIRQELFHGFFGWISYSLIRSERKDHPTTDWRLFDYDQTHVATLVASYDFGAGFQAGVRLRYSSGFPRTPVTGGTMNLALDRYEPVFGAQNSIRIPDFVQADVRVSKHFDFSATSKLDIFLDVQNVTDQQNREDIVYNYNYTKQNYITGLPTLPVLGARLEW